MGLFSAIGSAFSKALPVVGKVVKGVGNFLGFGGSGQNSGFNIGNIAGGLGSIGQAVGWGRVLSGKDIYGNPSYIPPRDPIADFKALMPLQRQADMDQFKDRMSYATGALGLTPQEAIGSPNPNAGSAAAGAFGNMTAANQSARTAQNQASQNFALQLGDLALRERQLDQEFGLRSRELDTRTEIAELQAGTQITTTQMVTEMTQLVAEIGRSGDQLYYNAVQQHLRSQGLKPGDPAYMAEFQKFAFVFEAARSGDLVKHGGAQMLEENPELGAALKVGLGIVKSIGRGPLGLFGKGSKFGRGKSAVPSTAPRSAATAGPAAAYSARNPKPPGTRGPNAYQMWLKAVRQQNSRGNAP